MYHALLGDLHKSKVVVDTKLSDIFKKAIPIMVIFGIVMIVALIVGNMPMIIDSIAKHTGVQREIVTETRIVYLTEEEARAQGMSVPPRPPDGAPLPSTTIECSPDREWRVTEEHPEGECALKEIPPEVEVTEEDASNPRMEGFDVLGNLLPKVQTGGFLPPARTGDGQTQEIGDLMENGTQTDTNSTKSEPEKVQGSAP